jgi:hypothetical protein
MNEKLRNATIDKEKSNSEADYFGLTLWLAYSHAMAEFDFTPRLAIWSPERRCGKSLLLEVISYLVPKSRIASGISPAALFRLTQDEPETVMLIDEADAIFGRYGNKESNEPLRSLLNSGFKRGQMIVRCDPKTFKPQEFQVFCPVVLAGIGTNAIPEAVKDRSIIIEMRRKYPHESITEFESDEVDEIFLPTRQLLSDAVESIRSEFRGLHPTMPKELNPRVRDAWKPLYRIVQALESRRTEKVWSGRAQVASLALSIRQEDPDEVSLQLRCLQDIRDVFIDDRMKSVDLVQALRNLEESPWSTSVELSTHLLAKLPRNYIIHSRPFSGGKVRGYRVEDFQESWKRYSPTPPTSE